MDRLVGCSNTTGSPREAQFRRSCIEFCLEKNNFFVTMDFFFAVDYYINRTFDEAFPSEDFVRVPGMHHWGASLAHPVIVSISHGPSCLNDPSMCLEFTVMFWLLVQSAHEQVIITAGDSCSNISHGNGLCMLATNTSFILTEGKDSELYRYEVKQPLIGTWTHLMVTHSQTTGYEFYVNTKLALYSSTVVSRKLDHLRTYEDLRFGKDIMGLRTGDMVIDEFHLFGHRLKRSEAKEIIGRRFSLMK